MLRIVEVDYFGEDRASHVSVLDTVTDQYLKDDFGDVHWGCVSEMRQGIKGDLWVRIEKLLPLWFLCLEDDKL